MNLYVVTMYAICIFIFILCALLCKQPLFFI